MKVSQLGTGIYVLGYHSKCSNEPILMVWPKPLLTEFGIHHRLENCEPFAKNPSMVLLKSVKLLKHSFSPCTQDSLSQVGTIHQIIQDDVRLNCILFLTFVDFYSTCDIFAINMS